MDESVALDDFVHGVVDNWRQAPLTPHVRALLEHVEQVTLHAAKCTAAHLERLRSAGWSDPAIHDAMQVAAYFNYINRIADALGVAPEPGLPHWGSSSP